ncbi:MAG: N-acyl homoserine lactonase family protein [Christensenellaceae bacterium]|jgi:glyoxylase-like metal-dependent hydrolase (beta-lactamase superfamily II)|nr:N-acyl homoserine lactonase family protein [Christensenellaceae bacterium]
MENLKVTAIKYGAYRMEKKFYDYEPGGIISQPIWGALIQGAGRNILVDTGLEYNLEWLNKNALPTTIEEDEIFENALAKAGGITPNDVDIVINTHMHYDHIGNNRLVKNALFYVSQREYQIAFAPMKCQAKLYENTHHLFDERAVDPFAWRFVTGITDVAPGVRIIPTPGHTDGHMSVFVKTAEGTLCVSGDAVNLIEALENRYINKFHSSIPDCYRSYDVILDNAVCILPGHEPSLQKFQSSDFPRIDGFRR